MKLWQKLRLYQKGVIVGFFIPSITFLLVFIGLKAFEYSDIPGDNAGSPLMLLGIVLSISNTFWMNILIWLLIGGMVGSFLQLSKNRLLIFNTIKYTVGILPIIFAIIFLKFSLNSFNIGFSHNNILYLAILLSIFILSLMLGLTIIRLKQNNRENKKN